MEKQIIVYEPRADIRLEVKTDGDTVWLTQEQMCRLFGRDQSVIARHIRNVFKEGELVRDSVYAKFAYTASDGKTYQVAYYNLDVIISVGYRVKSVQGTRFRQECAEEALLRREGRAQRRWRSHPQGPAATAMLREMLMRRCDELRRIGKLEKRMDAVEGDVKQIKGGMSYLVQQLSAPPEPPKRRRIGFGVDNDEPTKPYGKSR